MNNTSRYGTHKSPLIWTCKSFLMLLIMLTFDDMHEFSLGYSITPVSTHLVHLLTVESFDFL